MDPITATLMALGPIVTLIGRAVAEGDMREAMRLRQQAVAEFGDENLPVLDRLVAQEVGPSAVASIRGDDALRGRQTEVLDELRNVYETGGLTQADMAALQVGQNQVAQRAASDLASAQQRAARLGQTGNFALEGALGAQAGQAAAGATADMAYRTQADARQRALQALIAEGGMAGDVRAADFGEAATRGRAADAFTLFNADQRTAAQRGNNQNALAAFDARMTLKGARNQARAGVAQEFQNRARRTMDTAAGVGNAFTSAGSVLGGQPGKKKPPTEE